MSIKVKLYTLHKFDYFVCVYKLQEALIYCSIPFLLKSQHMDILEL